MSGRDTAQTSPAKAGERLLHGLFGRSTAPRPYSARTGAEERIGPGRHPGFYPARLPDADGAAFPADGRRPRRGAQTARPASSAATRRTRRRSPPRGTGMSDSSRGPAIIPPIRRDASPTIASTSASPGPVWSRWKSRIGFPTLSFKSFGAFVAGAAERAELVGDTGPSAPQNWIGGFGKGGDHVLVTLHAIGPEAMSAYSDRLSALFAERGAFREIWRRRRHGADGDARRRARSHVQGAFRLH